MKRPTFSRKGSVLDLLSVIVLVPETATDEVEVLQGLEDQGVSNGMAFSKNGVNGRIDLPAVLNWKTDGGFEVSVTTGDPARSIPAWFWLVEVFSGQRFAWWGIEQDRDKSLPWSV